MSKRVIYRDAATGRIVTAEYAAAHSETTTREQVDHNEVITPEMVDAGFEHYRAWLGGDVMYWTGRDAIAGILGAALAAKRSA